MLSWAHIRQLAAAVLLIPSLAWAGPYAAAGDMALRHDVQVLADYGLISAPVYDLAARLGPNS